MSAPDSRYVDEVIDATQIFDVTPLPCITLVGEKRSRPDVMDEAIAINWRAQCFGPARDMHGFNDWRLQATWSVERLISGEVHVRDDSGRTRALIVQKAYRDDPVLVLLPRYYVNLESIETGQIRAAGFDRSTGNRIRVSPPIPPGSSAAAAAQLRAEYESWLEEIRPGHADPFLYW